MINKYLGVTQKLHGDLDPNMAQAHLIVGSYCDYTKDFQQSIVHYEKVLDIGEKIGGRYGADKEKILLSLSRLHSELKNTKISLPYAFEALNFFLKRGAKPGYAIGFCLFICSIHFETAKDFRNKRNILARALRAYEHHSKTKGLEKTKSHLNRLDMRELEHDRGIPLHI